MGFVNKSLLGAPQPPANVNLNPMYGNISSGIIAKKNENDTYRLYYSGNLLAVASSAEEMVQLIEQALTERGDELKLENFELMKKIKFQVGVYMIED